MKMRVKGLIAVASILLAATCADAGTGDREKVEDLVIQFGNAYRDGDTETVNELLASEYSHINNGAKPIGREAYLDWNRKRQAKLNSGAWSVTTYELSDLEVTTFGDSAIVTGLVTASGKRDGENWSSKVRFTNLWVRERGTWKRAGFHDTKLDEEKQGRPRAGGSGRSVCP